ncbi:putative nuclease HARBI1 [Diprion similis]|uniref:putative nuclease HARBI1 n=1 Tax=Diprion similis TaxID=362088 RepID=UPI001EF83A50|nr:putative nuclease HARBI1 [Diprion similis]
MAMGWLANAVLDAEEDEDAVAELMVNRRQLRDEQNPFELPEVQFQQLFRLSRKLASDLVNHLRPHLERDRSHGLSVECQVLCAVRFYAVGSYQRAIGQDFMVAISQTAVSRCLKSVSAAINDHLLQQWVKFPATPQQREEARRKFPRAPQPFTGAIGAIDRTHIAILSPQEHEEAYVNHHGYHSLNVQMVCDPNLRILNVNARFPGSRHDAAIWTQSPVRTLMEMCYGDGEHGTWLLGDSGYPLKPWLMTPITNARVGTAEFAYTTAHCKARSVIERCFGVLKVVWRCLSQQRVLMYDHEAAGRIVNACATLHNMRLHYGVLPLDDVPVTSRTVRLRGRR